MPAPSTQPAVRSFRSESGRLYITSVRPEKPLAYLGVLHGYGDHSGRFLHFLRWLGERGIAAYSFDFRGHGQSAGRRGAVSAWSEYVADLDQVLALEELQPERRDGAPFFMLGHSHGALVLSAAVIRGLSGISGIVLTAPYFRSRMHVPVHKALLARAVNGILPWLPVPSGLEPEWMSSDLAMVEDSRADPLCLQHATPRWFLGSRLAQADVRSHAADFRLPLLALIGTADPIADPEAVRRFVGEAGSPDKTYREYPGLLHEVLRETDRETVFRDILAWIQARGNQEKAE